MSFHHSASSKSLLITEMECDTPMVTHDKRVLVGQLEICDAEKFIKEKEEKIVGRAFMAIIILALIVTVIDVMRLMQR